MLSHMLANGGTATGGEHSSAGTGTHRTDPETHVFVSGDADLFLLSLVQGVSQRVVVVNEVNYSYAAKGARRSQLRVCNSLI
jgi:hypothetical protein